MFHSFQIIFQSLGYLVHCNSCLLNQESSTIDYDRNWIGIKFQTFYINRTTHISEERNQTGLRKFQVVQFQMSYISKIEN